MKHFVRDSIIYFISCLGIAFVYRTFMKRNGPLVRVIAFHDVDDAQWFRNIIASLKRDFHIISPTEYEQGHLVVTKINILITFDDGYESWVTTCLPVLKEYGVQGLFFVNSGLLTAGEDREHARSFVQNRLMLSPKNVLTFTGAQTLIDNGHTVGGHTMNHTSLKQASNERVTEEIVHDKEIIEASLGVVVRHFAYPFGTWRDYSRETERQVRSAGYSFVYTAEPGFSSTSEAHIPRTLVEQGQVYAKLRRWMYGSYDIFAYLNRLFRSSMKHNQAR